MTAPQSLILLLLLCSSAYSFSFNTHVALLKAHQKASKRSSWGSYHRMWTPRLNNIHLQLVDDPVYLEKHPKAALKAKKSAIKKKDANKTAPKTAKKATEKLTKSQAAINKLKEMLHQLEKQGSAKKAPQKTLKKPTKPTAKKITKPAAKPAVKPAPKPATKPAAKPTPKPAPKKPQFKNPLALLAALLQKSQVTLISLKSDRLTIVTALSECLKKDSSKCHHFFKDIKEVDGKIRAEKKRVAWLKRSIKRMQKN